jgi:hypothetical protein
MKRIFIIGYATLLFASVVYAQEETPAPPPGEPQVPAGNPGMSRSTPPSQAVVPVPVPMVPPKPNGPVQKSLVRITATSVDPDYKAPWNAGGLQRGVGGTNLGPALDLGAGPAIELFPRNRLHLHQLAGSLHLTLGQRCR